MPATQNCSLLKPKVHGPGVARTAARDSTHQHDNANKARSRSSQRMILADIDKRLEHKTARQGGVYPAR